MLIGSVPDSSGCSAGERISDGCW